MPLISVIVPVYNVEKYIEKCLDSISNQTMNDIEIIIVNDGSEDNSETVIKHWIENNNGIKVKYLKKENGGLSDARNFGVQYATGKYISFIDSDDYIDEDLFKNLEKYTNEGIDIIKFKMKKVDEKGNILEKLEGPVFDKCTGEEAFEKLCTIDKYLDPACIYLYKRDFFINNNFEYNVGTYHEDFGLTPLIIVKAHSFISAKEIGYNYLQRNDSITGNENIEKNIKKSKDLLIHYDNMIKTIENYNIKNKTKVLIKRYYTNTLILKSKELIENSKEFDNYINELNKRKLYKNIKPYNIKQLLKRLILQVNIKMYLKIKYR